MKHRLLPLIPVIALLGCDRAKTDAPADADTPAAAKPAQAAEPAQAATAPSTAKAPPAFPPEARRNSVPEGMTVLAEGAATPPMRELVSTAGPWSRSDTPTIVAFYRGFW